MKKILIIILIALSFTSVHAQFTNAVLQASGLTCAMCTRAIDQSLEKLSFVKSVAPDIENSSFSIVFKPGVSMNIDQLKKAVEEAGFSVSKLKLTGNFSNVAVENDGHVVINGNNFHFLKVASQVLNGKKDITIVDRNFIPAKEFKKWSAATQMKCIQSGKADGCCDKARITANPRMYHATI